jgi:hypothetical protein
MMPRVDFPNVSFDDDVIRDENVEDKDDEITARSKVILVPAPLVEVTQLLMVMGF